MRLFSKASLLAVIFVASVQLLQAQAQLQTDRQLKTTPSASPKKESQEVGENDVVRVTTSLVRVPVSVRDRDGRYVIDLKQEDFHVNEDGGEQRISYFGGVEEPISVVLL